ncbi:substrate-binding domain-containing protein [Micromonospora sp. DR5-3]|uniref:GntR family transcriptional regulator n=1 Tax=unclassified Micromonospora TaxID=2617518 RepID=UPI0011D51317|nr:MULTISPECIES: substrate-binding domain-containing protein [unclassified Micromonospora]MCW3815976.1 substrate-binding domain-containing protein [Micromonospora sp. DR5-3]TYC20833.1 GntR family transcriptional regulator [Micromonospora sp. MP36]
MVATQPDAAPRRSRSARDASTRDLKFQQLAGVLRRGILAGDWAAGTKLPTESQLARETGLSLTTVRRAYEELVGQGLVVRRQGAGSFVTVPNRREPRTRWSIGVLVPDTQLYYPRVLQGIEEALSAAAARLQLSTYHYDRREEELDLQFLLDSGVDGLLLVPTLLGLDDPAGRADQLMSLPVPAVLLERRLADAGPGDRTEHVCSDHGAGAYDAVAHLNRLGHNQIALLTRGNNPTEAAVKSGFERAMQDLGLPADNQHCAVKDRWDPDLADEYLSRLLDSSVTAALVFGDREAALIEGAARRRGIRIPEQLALVSYDDETADVAEVPLTAVSPPKYRVGRMAAEVLLRRLTEGDACPLHQIRLRPRIVIRASCGARLAERS